MGQEQPETQACRFVEAEPPETEARASFIPSLGDCDGSMDEPGAEVSACCNLKGEVSYLSTSLGISWNDSCRLIG